MKIKELANYCKSIEIDCDKCKQTSLCQNLTEQIEDISPIGLVELIEEDHEL